MAKKPPNNGAWVWYRDPSSDECIFHEMPVDDLIEHTASTDCMCGPTMFEDLDGVMVVAHPSLDNREEQWHKP